MRYYREDICHNPIGRDDASENFPINCHFRRRRSSLQGQEVADIGLRIVIDHRVEEHAVRSVCLRLTQCLTFKIGWCAACVGWSRRSPSPIA
eukprot:3056262-Amphidinium_carterae.1